MKHKLSNYLQFFVLIVLSFCLASCGATTKTTISPTTTPNVRYVPADNPVVLAGIRNVAVFPFADYSHQQKQLGVEEWGGNIKIVEAIIDQLSAHGITVAVQEDVNTLLVNEKIIRPIDKEKYLAYGDKYEEEENNKKISTPDYEVSSVQHSPDMILEVNKIISLNSKKSMKNTHTPVLQGATVGLSKEKIIELGGLLNVDTIIRGRIIDYGYKDIGTLNPLYRGFIPVVIDSVKDLMYGATNAYGYENDLENIENMAVGGGLGYAVAKNVTSPDISKTGATALGVASGWMASQHPKKAVRSAVVQVRLYAQNATNGEVLWTNRCEIEYTPSSNFMYNDTHPKTMFDNAVKTGVKCIMDDFFKQAADYSQAVDDNSRAVQDNSTTFIDAKPGV